MPCYLAIDCGLTQIKAAVIDDTGRALSLSGATTPVRGTAIDVAALTENLYRVVGDALKQANVTVTQICAAGHGNGLYYIENTVRTNNRLQWRAETYNYFGILVGKTLHHFAYPILGFWSAISIG